MTSTAATTRRIRNSDGPGRVQVTRWRGRVLTDCARETLRFGCSAAKLNPSFSPPLLRGPVGTETLQNIALFDKCKNFTRAREIQAAGLYPYFKPISHSEDTTVVIEGKPRIMMGSNNYLGLTHHPDVLAAAKAALERYGSGLHRSRFLNGTLDLHEQPEAELAEFFHKKACPGVSTRHQAQPGVISGVGGGGGVRSGE